MPFIVLTLLLSVVLGLWAPRATALAVTAVAAAATVVAHVWAVADGKGDDPWWVVLVGSGGALLALVVCERLSAARAHRSAEEA